MPITFLTLKEATERYDLSSEQLHRLVRDGEISLVTVNGQRLVDEEEVRRVTGGNDDRVHWISLEEAARRYGLGEVLLERLAKDGVIRSGVLEDELHLAAEDVEPVATRLNKRNFRDLEGVPIELARAAERYGFSLQTLLSWARRGHIRMVKESRRPILLDEADVAYAKTLADIRGIVGGKALFPTSRQYFSVSPWLAR